MSSELLRLEAELAADERAIRHLIGERAALSSQIKRRQAHERLVRERVHAITTHRHPILGPAGGPLPHGDRFVDVSGWQPHVDFAAVRGAVALRTSRIAFTKLTEGPGWTDPYGAGRLREMAAAGFPHRGAYHYYHPDVSPIEQAHHFLEVAHSNGVVVRPSDVLCCDVEQSSGQSAGVVRSGVRLFGGELAKHVPAKRWLYSGGPFVREFGLTLEGYDAHWLPAYVGDPGPFIVFGRARTIAWQYSDGVYGPVPRGCPGVGPVDMSILL